MGHINSTTINTDRKIGKHLNFEDRCSIKVFRKLKYSMRRIADELNCSLSTIMYELRRGTGERNGARGRFPEYSARRGQNRYDANRSCCHKHTRVTADNPFVVWALSMIRSEHWSIDACVGYAQIHNLFPSEDIICTKTFYNAVWNGTISLTPFDLPEALMRRFKKARIRKNKRIFGRSIDERAEVATSREEIGHWEIDTVVGKKSSSESYHRREGHRLLYSDEDSR